MTLQLSGNDWHGSPMLSRTSGTNTSHAWSPFGAGATLLLPGFNGERQDPLSGVTHLGNGYRAYSPVLRRFTCPDSESPFGIGGINPYAYCESDPINQTDPSGHGPITWLIRKIIGLSVRAGIKAAMADGASASLATAGTVETGVELATSAVTGQASRAVAKSNPRAAKVLGWMSLGLGIAGTAGVAEKLAPQIGGKIKGISGRIQRLFTGANGDFITMGGAATNSLCIGEAKKLITVFEDNYKGTRRLNIMGHSHFDKAAGMALMEMDEGNLTPALLAELLESNQVDMQQFQQIRLLSCYSANGGKHSFAAEIHRITGKPVKAYKGKITINRDITMQHVQDILPSAFNDSGNTFRANFNNGSLINVEKENPHSILSFRKWYQFSYSRRHF
jgi:RHS repeat-associated protein